MAGVEWWNNGMVERWAPSVMFELMRFKARPIEVPEDDPFKEDLLSRKASAEALTDLVESLAEPFVLAIDSPWGTGKSVFLRMWLQFLRNRGFCCLHFNAWENDFTDSPLVSLIGEVGAELEKLRVKSDSEAAKLFDRTKKVGALLVKSFGPAAIKVATSGLIDLSGIKEGEFGKVAEEFAKQQIERYQADKKTIHHFREDLRKLVSCMGKENSASKPVIFVIDELDRCRPPYAIELLEKIKHLFSVEGLVFVLAVDRRQLGESVRSMYGAGMDTGGYFRRFIDLEFRLPPPEGDGFVRAQFGRFGLDQAFVERMRSEDAEDLAASLVQLFALFRFSLRTQEQCFAHLVVVIRTTPAKNKLFVQFLALLLCLRIVNGDLYFRYCNGEVAQEDVLAYIQSFPGGEALIKSNLGTLLEAYLIFGIIDEKARRVVIKRCRESGAAAALGNTPESKRDGVLLDMLEFVASNGINITGYLFKRIEMANRFVAPGPNA
jgi:hypothetical protein